MLIRFFARLFYVYRNTLYGRTFPAQAAEKREGFSYTVFIIHRKGIYFYLRQFALAIVTFTITFACRPIMLFICVIGPLCIIVIAVFASIGNLLAIAVLGVVFLIVFIINDPFRVFMVTVSSERLWVTVNSTIITYL